MSNQCQITRGFFIQRACGRDGTIECEQCKKRFCSKHRARHVAGKSLCVECGGVRHSGEDSERKKSRWDRNDHSWEDDNTFPYHLRRNHHSRYHPIWYHHPDEPSGQHHDPAIGAQSDLGSEMESFGEDPNQPLEDFGFESDDGDISAFDS